VSNYDPFLPVANGKYRPDRLAYFVGSGPSLFNRTAGGVGWTASLAGEKMR